MKAKCLNCKRKKELVERSDYCKECYDELAQRIKRALDRINAENGRPAYQTENEV